MIASWCAINLLSLEQIQTLHHSAAAASVSAISQTRRRHRADVPVQIGITTVCNQFQCRAAIRRKHPHLHFSFFFLLAHSFYLSQFSRSELSPRGLAMQNCTHEWVMVVEIVLILAFTLNSFIKLSPAGKKRSKWKTVCHLPRYSDPTTTHETGVRGKHCSTGP